MDGQKKNRIAAAIAVNVVILAVMLAVFLIYLIVEIVDTSKKIEWLNSEIEKTSQEIEDKEKDLDYLQSEQYLLDLLFQQGYYFPKN